jgi:phosphatidylglycerol---prolipoprotein diacylglyceryl transferase
MYPRFTDLFRDLLGFEFPITLYTFGLMVATALLTAAMLTRRELDRRYAAGEIGPVEVKEQDAKGRTRTVKASPGVLVWTMMGLAAVFGVIGAKVFHILDNFGDFLLQPGRYLLTPDGMAFWGGLIVAGTALALYARRKGISVPVLADAVAPTLLLGYGIGRIGCYLAGDGDWGRCSSLADKPAWIPSWLWSETFPRNILNRDLLAECGPGYDGVYPTMLYEFAMAAALAAVLWSLRKHPFRYGWLFSLYLVFAGAERFLIELIRVNVVWFEVGGLAFTQAMIIAVLMVISGGVGLALLSRRRHPAAPPPVAPPVSA